MKNRIVTVILAVALAVWWGEIGFAQVQEDAVQEGVTQESIKQEDILDFVAPASETEALQAGLPLRGAIDGAVLPETDGALTAAPPASRPLSWLEKIRRLPSDHRAREIAALSAGLLVFLGAGWIFTSAAFRRRARRSYRRFPRSSGGSKVRGLEQVVAAVQLGRATSTGRSPMRRRAAGRSH
jgi:hypothetical protein